jgi:hypothetical protein
MARWKISYSDKRLKPEIVNAKNKLEAMLMQKISWKL